MKKLGVLLIALVIGVNGYSKEEQGKVIEKREDNLYYIDGNLVDGTRIKDEDTRKIEKTYKDGKLLKEKIYDGEKKKVTYLKNYDEYGLLNGRVVEDEVEYEYYHGFLDGKMVGNFEGDKSAGSIDGELTMGVFNGVVNLNHEKHKVLAGVVVDETKADDIELFNIKKYIEKSIVVVEDSEKIDKSIGENYTGSVYVVDSESGDVGEVYIYEEGYNVADITLADGRQLMEIIKDRDGKTVEVSKYSSYGGDLIKKEKFNSNMEQLKYIGKKNDSMGNDIVILNYVDGVLNGRVIYIMFSDEDIEMEAEKVEGYYNLGLYTGIDPYTKRYYVDGILEDEGKKGSKWEENITFKSKVEDISRFTGYLKEKVEGGLKISRYETGKLKEERNYKEVESYNLSGVSYEIKDRVIYEDGEKTIEYSY